jgi:hypothetical protein
MLLYDSYVCFCSCAFCLQLRNFFAVMQFAFITYLYLVFLTENCYTLLINGPLHSSQVGGEPVSARPLFPQPHCTSPQHLYGIIHLLSPHSTLPEKLALGVRSMPLLLPLAAAVVTPVGHLLLPTPSWPVSIVAVTAVNQRTKD